MCNNGKKICDPEGVGEEVIKLRRMAAREAGLSGFLYANQLIRDEKITIPADPLQAAQTVLSAVRRSS